jgi:hypothetical protein
MQRRSQSTCCYKKFKVPKDITTRNVTKKQLQVMNRIQNKKARSLNYKIVFQWVKCIIFVFFIIQKANTSTSTG